MARRTANSKARPNRKNRSSADLADQIDGTNARSIVFDNPVIAGGWLVMLLTVAIIIANATSFQSEPHPAPLFSTRDAAPLAADQTQSSRAPAYSLLVHDAQLELRRLGFYEGLLDGIKGPATDRAVRAYQRSRSLSDTGKISAALVARLSLDTGEASGGLPSGESVPVPQSAPTTLGTPLPPADVPVSPVTGSSGIPRPASQPEGDRRILQAQSILADLGYGPVAVDGLMGDETASAIRRFELDRGLPITGSLNDRVSEELERMSGRKLVDRF
ncbi:peptidoglycan-binding protein [Stappia sp. GBMRC 2046]|uniref:Peptidoglycan-binding protein n=1 Tax=Stappia sediminis TaxID=2692190 RepID=A0A7X3S8F4_9HYPH|nr:peptidoglycan-binding protein [Stappia sediminis]MXN65729.1 peptidoglycan-binding protein [Stappia sediminis]